METWFAVYICMSGPSCPKNPIVSSKSFYSLQTCNTDARLIAQGMYVSSGNKYGYRCEKVDYEPPEVPK